MADEFELEVKCPFEECPNKKKIKVPGYIFQNKQFGTVKIQINKGFVCPDHQFVIFVDKKGKIRSYEKIDLQLVVAKKAEPKVSEKVTLNGIIKSIGDFATVNILHGLLLNVPINVVVKEFNKDREVAMNYAAKQLFPSMFEDKNPVKFLERKDYKKQKIKNILTIDEEGYILAAPWEINKFDFEENILKKSVVANDFKAQAVIFQQLVSNLIKKVEYVKELMTKNETIYEEDLKTQFAEKFMQKKVSDYDIDLVKEILKFRYLEDVSKIKIRSFDKLRESLW